MSSRSSRSPDKKRLVSRPLSPAHKRGKSSPDVAEGLPPYSPLTVEPDVHEGLAPYSDANHVVLDATDDTPSKRPQQPVLYSGPGLSAGYNRAFQANKQREKRPAVRRALQQGNEPDETPNGSKSRSRWSKEWDRQANVVGSQNASSPSRQQDPYKKTSRQFKIHKRGEFSQTSRLLNQRNNSKKKAETERIQKSKLGEPLPSRFSGPAPERPFSGDPSLERAVAGNVDDTIGLAEEPSGMSSPSSKISPHRRFSSSKPMVPLGPLDLDSPASPQGNSLISGALNIYVSATPYEGLASGSMKPPGTDVPRRKLSDEAESPFPFNRSLCPSPSPSLPQAEELPGPCLYADESERSSIDKIESRGRAAEPIEPLQLSGAGSKDESPWSKEYSEWRTSEKVRADVINGKFGSKRIQQTSQDSDAEANQALTSLRAHSTSPSSFSTNVTNECTSEIKGEHGQAQDIDISTWRDGVSGDEKTCSLQVEVQHPLMGFRSTTEPVTVKNVDQDQATGNDNQTAEQARAKPPITAPDASAAGEAIKAINLHMQENVDRLEPFPDLTQAELYYCGNDIEGPADLVFEDESLQVELYENARPTFTFNPAAAPFVSFTEQASVPASGEPNAGPGTSSVILSDAQLAASQRQQNEYAEERYRQYWKRESKARLRLEIEKCRGNESRSEQTYFQMILEEKIYEEKAGLVSIPFRPGNGDERPAKSASVPLRQDPMREPRLQTGDDRPSGPGSGAKGTGDSMHEQPRVHLRSLVDGANLSATKTSPAEATENRDREVQGLANGIREAKAPTAAADAVRDDGEVEVDDSARHAATLQYLIATSENQGAAGRPTQSTSFALRDEDQGADPSVACSENLPWRGQSKTYPR